MLIVSMIDCVCFFFFSSRRRHTRSLRDCSSDVCSSDLMLGDDPELQTPVRGGLAWLDHECDDRYGKTFVACAAGERGAVLDAIAWPAKAKPEHAAGVEIGRASCRERG